MKPQELMDERSLGRNGSGDSQIPPAGTATAPLKTAADGAAEDARPRWWRDRRRRRTLAGADAIVAAGIGLAVAELGSASAAWALAALPLGLLTAKLVGLYDTDHRAIRHLTIDELPTIAVWCALVAMGCVLLTPGRISAVEAVMVLIATIFLAATLRAFARLLWRHSTPPEATLVLGSGEPAQAIARKVELFADMHLRLVRSEDPATALQRRNGDEEAVMDRTLAGIDRVVLAWADADPNLIAQLLAHCRRREVKLSVVSPFRGGARPAPAVSQVADLPVLEYNTWDVPRSTAAIKRWFDVVGSCIALAALAPLFVAIAMAIRLDDGGAVFFRQQRAGRNQRPFGMLKFRSMCVDAEEQLANLVDLDALESPMFKLRPDPRITRVGDFLRRHSLDELPQLINVLRGEMSLVGPRPEQLAVVDRYSPEHMFRLSVKPGVTGPMQVFGRGELSFEERLAVEIEYVENVSLTRDLRLLAQTVPAVLRGKGAF